MKDTKLLLFEEMGRIIKRGRISHKRGDTFCDYSPRNEGLNANVPHECGDGVNEMNEKMELR